MKTITQEMRDRAAQIQKIIEDAGVLVEREGYAVKLKVYEEPHKGEILMIVQWKKEDEMRQVWYMLNQDYTSTLAQVSLFRMLPRIDAEAISEDLRWLLGEDGKK